MFQEERKKNVSGWILVGGRRRTFLRSYVFVVESSLEEGKGASEGGVDACLRVCADGAFAHNLRMVILP